MDQEKYMSPLRNLMMTVQGQNLRQVMIREATALANAHAERYGKFAIHSAEEVFHALKENLYNKTNEMSTEESFRIVSDAANLQNFKDETYNDILEEFDWDETLKVLLEGLSERDLPIVKALLENQHNLIKSESAFDTTASHSASLFNKWTIPLVRRIYDNMPVTNLVGVQAMQGPVGMVFKLQYKTEDDDVNPNELEGQGGKRMSLQIVRGAVEAQTRKLEACWSIEAMQDAKNMHVRGVDLEAELMSGLASQIRSEITDAIINDLRALGNKNVVEHKLEGTTIDQQEAMHICINQQASAIAFHSRRGAGNFVVVSQAVLELMAKYKHFEGEDIPVSKYLDASTLFKVGRLNDTYDVYVSKVLEPGQVLVGYKGTSEVDTGYIHCPYISIMSSGVTVDPDTFEPRINLMNRSGKYVLLNEDEEDSDAKMSDSRNYYRLLEFDSRLLKASEEDKEEWPSNTE